MRDEEKYTNTEEQLLYLQKLLDEEDTAALNELFNELDILAIARTLESFPAKTRDLLWEYIPETMLGEVLAEVEPRKSPKFSMLLTKRSKPPSTPV